MILSAMMFALGVFVTGLLALGFCVALVRRTRRITERRLMNAVSLRRSEFEAERDELRARHAIEAHRLEREIARVLDMATAHRLDADVKDRDLRSIRVELDGKDDEIEELQIRLEAQRQTLQDAERKHAESSTSLRAARHALKLESRRRVAVEDTFDQAVATAEEKRVEIGALQAQIEALRQSLTQTETAGSTPANDDGAEWVGGGVVQLPSLDTLRRVPRLLRQREASGREARQSAEQATAVATQELAAAGPEPLPASATGTGPGGTRRNASEDPESLFVEALAEIRALKRAAGSEAAE